MQAQARQISLLERGVVAVLFAAACYYALFVLPYRFPPRELLWSASYAFGYNNRLAIVGFAGILGLAALWLRWRGAAGLRHDASPEPGAPGRGLVRLTLALVVLAYAAATLAMYVFYERSHPWLMWEVRHLMHRSQLMEIYGLRAYTDFQEEYGPLLTYAPVIIHRLLDPLGASLTQSYFIAHFLLDAAGVGCIAYVLSRIAMDRRARAVALVVLGVAGFGLWMGLNGVLLRYAGPFASLLFGHHAFLRLRDMARWTELTAGSLLVAVLLGIELLLSPEVAVAFAATWFLYAVLRLRDNPWVLGATLAGFAMAAAFCAILLPPAYFSGVLQFSQGANNLPLVPAAHILLFVVTMFLVVPEGLALAFVPGPSPTGTCAMAALCLAMLPGALGRCDPPHVLLFGIGAATLAMARLSRRKAHFLTYVAAYGLVSIGMMQAVSAYVFFGIKPGSQAISQIRARLVSAAPAGDDAGTLSHLARYPRLGLPFATFGDPLAEEWVVSHGQLQPEFYTGIVGIYTPQALERKLRDISHMQYILVPRAFLVPGHRNSCAEHLRSLRQWFLYHADLACVAQDLDPSAAVSDYVASRFTQRETLRSWAVLEHRPEQGTSAVP